MQFAFNNVFYESDNDLTCWSTKYDTLSFTTLIPPDPLTSTKNNIGLPTLNLVYLSCINTRYIPVSLLEISC